MYSITTDGSTVNTRVIDLETGEEVKDLVGIRLNISEIDPESNLLELIVNKCAKNEYTTSDLYQDMDYTTASSYLNERFIGLEENAPLWIPYDILMDENVQDPVVLEERERRKEFNKKAASWKEEERKEKLKWAEEREEKLNTFERLTKAHEDVLRKLSEIEEVLEEKRLELFPPKEERPEWAGILHDKGHPLFSMNGSTKPIAYIKHSGTNSTAVANQGYPFPKAKK